MKSIVTQGIVLSRTDYGEADRIVTMLTPDQGKLRLMARGVRKVKSKLAGGIELFSVSDITYLPGKGEIGTLMSTRLLKHFGEIVKDIDRVQLGYELIKMLHRATEDEPEKEYFDLLETALESLDNHDITKELIKVWYQAQLLKLAGHSPNLQTDTGGQSLDAKLKYNFDYESMSFAQHGKGRFNADDIKFTRLLFSQNPPKALSQIEGCLKFVKSSGPVVQTMLQNHIRL